PFFFITDKLKLPQKGLFCLNLVYRWLQIVFPGSTEFIGGAKSFLGAQLSLSVEPELFPGSTEFIGGPKSFLGAQPSLSVAPNRFSGLNRVYRWARIVFLGLPINHSEGLLTHSR
ncbi:MAG: hypothetical protein LBD21_02165, partial [Tannerellaceae bacterium]|nr:hypothetical protein [Tannerellaceae bacterium]